MEWQASWIVQCHLNGRSKHKQPGRIHWQPIMRCSDPLHTIALCSETSQVVCTGTTKAPWLNQPTRQLQWSSSMYRTLLKCAIPSRSKHTWYACTAC